MSDNVHVLDYKNVSLPQDVVDKILWLIKTSENRPPAELIFEVVFRIGDDFSFIPFIPIMRRNRNEIVIMDQSTYYTLGSMQSFPKGFLPLKCDTVLEILNYFGSERTIKFTLAKEVNFVVDRPDSIIRNAGQYFPSFYQENFSNLMIGGVARRFSTLSKLGVNLF